MPVSPAPSPAAQGETPTQVTDSSPPPSAPANFGQAALDAETIQHLHSTRAFRKRFQVPEAAATIADRINQKCHHDWIETFRCRTGRCAQQSSTRPAAAEALAPERLPC